jgi:hypothetical protein
MSNVVMAGSRALLGTSALGMPGQTCARRCAGGAAVLSVAPVMQYGVFGTALAGIAAVHATAAATVPAATRDNDRKVDVKGVRAWSPPV